MSEEREDERYEAQIARLEAELSRLRAACSRDNEEISQVLGHALGYPKYADDQKSFPGATDADGVCVGDHVAVTLVAESAERIERLTAERDAIEAKLEKIDTIAHEHFLAAGNPMPRGTTFGEGAMCLAGELPRLRGEVDRLKAERDEARESLKQLWIVREDIEAERNEARAEAFWFRSALEAIRNFRAFRNGEDPYTQIAYFAVCSAREALGPVRVDDDREVD